MRYIIALVLAVVLAVPAFADAAATKALNDLRASKGRAAVVYSERLARAAQAHANDMARKGFFSHTGSNGSKLGDRVKRAGYKFCYASENIAKGQKSVAAVINAWAGSSGHYKNMTNRKAREFGIARASGNIWVMVLARPC